MHITIPTGLRRNLGFAGLIAAAVLFAGSVPTHSFGLPGGWEMPEMNRVTRTVSGLTLPLDPMVSLDITAWGQGYDGLDDWAESICDDMEAQFNERYGDGTFNSPRIQTVGRYAAVSVSSDGNRIGVTCDGRQTWTEDVTVTLGCGETRWGNGWPSPGGWYSSRSAWDCSYYSSWELTNGSYDFYGPVVLEDQPRNHNVSICFPIAVELVYEGKTYWLLVPTEMAGESAPERRCRTLNPDWTHHARGEVAALEPFDFMDRGTRPTAGPRSVPQGCVAAAGRHMAWLEESQGGDRPSVEAVRVLRHTNIPDGVQVCSAKSTFSDGSERSDFNPYRGAMVCASGEPESDGFRWAIASYFAGGGPDWTGNEGRSISRRAVQDALAACLAAVT